jgi:hypothetical protein
VVLLKKQAGVLKEEIIQISYKIKKMKQNFQLHYFYGENENAIRKDLVG